MENDIVMANFKIRRDLRKKFKVLCTELDLDMTAIHLCAIASVIEMGKSREGRRILKETYKRK